MQSFKDLFFEVPFIPKKVKKSALALEIAKKNWTSIVGKKLVKRIRPCYFKEGTLFVEVPDYYYLQLIAPYSLEIVKRLEKKVPSELRPLFKEVHFKVNPYLEDSEIEEVRKKEISKEKVEEILKEVCSIIKDEELKKEFKSLIKSYFSTGLSSL